MKRSDDFFDPFTYQIESTDLEPRLSSVLNNLDIPESEIHIDINTFKFSDVDYQTLLNLANELSIKNEGLFILRLRQLVRLNLIEKSIVNNNRQSDLDRELKQFKSAAKKLNDIFLSMSDENKSNVLNTVNGGVKNILGNEEYLNSSYICRLLTLFEHAGIGIEQERYKRIHTPLKLIKSLHSFWELCIPADVINKRGNKAKFETLIEIVLRNTNQPKEDPKYWIKKLDLG